MAAPMFMNYAPAQIPALYGDAANNDPGDCVVLMSFDFLFPTEQHPEGETFPGKARPLLKIPKYHLLSFNMPGNDWIPMLIYIAYSITSSSGHLVRKLPGGGEVVLERTPADNAWLRLPETSDVTFRCTTSTCILDRRILDAVSSTRASKRDPSFTDAVKDRDGNRCLFTGDRDNEAIHLIRRNKGDEYITQLSSRRRHPSRTPGDEIEEVDDIRNGLIASSSIHKKTARGEMAIIRTPIPGILNSAELHTGVLENHDLYTVVYLTNIYDPNDADIVVVPAMSHVPVPQPANAPPHWVMDVVFGTAALHAWKVSDDAVLDTLSKWDDEWYPSIVTRGGPSNEEAEQARKDAEKSREGQASRDERAEKRGKRSQGDTVEAEDTSYFSFTDEGKLVLPDKETLRRIPPLDLAELAIALGVFGPPRLPPTLADDCTPIEAQRIDEWRKEVARVS